MIWDMEPPEPEAELRSVAPVTHTGEPEPGVCVEGPPRGWYLLHLERQEEFPHRDDGQPVCTRTNGGIWRKMGRTWSTGEDGSRCKRIEKEKG